MAPESPLRRHLRRHLPIWWMVGIAVVLLLDAQQAPANQATSRLYVLLVEQYQRFGRPLLHGRVACRFHPTCSEYSIAAVERHGTWQGLRLTIDRLSRCRTIVPLGTADDVP